MSAFIHRMLLFRAFTFKIGLIFSKDNRGIKQAQKNRAFRQKEFSRKFQMDYFGKIIHVVIPEDLLMSKLIRKQEFHSPLQSGILF